MTSIIAPLTVLGLFTIAIVAVGTGTAFAASPAYCALYAREYATQFSDGSGTNQRIQDQAYYRCLNLDEDPEFPDDDDEESSIELMKSKWPLGHLAKVLGVQRERLIRLPRQKTALLDLKGEVPPGPLWHLFPAALTSTLNPFEGLTGVR